MFFEKLETRRMFASTVVSAVAMPKVPQVLIEVKVATAKQSAAAEVGNVLQGITDPAKLAGKVAAAPNLPGLVEIPLDPSQRPSAGDLGNSTLRSLLGDSLLQELTNRFGKSANQLNDLSGSATSTSGREIIDVLGADLASMRSIYEQAQGDRTSQSSNAVVDFFVSIWNAITGGSNTDTQPPANDEQTDDSDATVPDPPIEPIVQDPDDLDEVDCARLDKAKAYEHFCVRKGRNNEGTPDPNSDDVALTPHQQQAIDQLWALVSKYIINPPRLADQGTGLISQPPHGETLNKKTGQLPSAEKIFAQRLAPYINPGSGDDGTGTQGGNVSEAPKPRPGVVDDFGQKYGAIPNLAPSVPSTPSNTAGGTTTGGGVASGSQQP